MVRILEEVPQSPLVGRAQTGPEVLPTLVLGVGFGEMPLGSVVGVLAAGLQVEVVQAPVLQLLAVVLDTDLGRLLLPGGPLSL